MSLEEKYYNVNVTLGMAYTVDTLNPEDANVRKAAEEMLVKQKEK